MPRKIIAILSSWTLIALAGLAACDDEQDGISGDFEFTVIETEDTCDGVLNNYSAQFSISRDGENVTVSFGEEAVLTGIIDDEGVIQASGPASITIPVNGQPVTVESNFQIQIVVFPDDTIEANGRLTFDGTHPSAPGEVCVQEFTAADGRRLLAAPLL